MQAGGSAIFDVDLGASDLITLGDGTIAIKIQGATQLTGALNIDNTLDIDTSTANPVTITTDLQTASSGLTIEMDGADVSAQQYGLEIEYKDDAQTNCDFIICKDDADGSPATVFSVASDGAIASTGSIDVDGACNLGDTTAGSDVALGNSTGNITVLSDNVDFTLTDAIDNVFQIIQAAGGTLFDIDLGASDLITIGDGTIAVKIEGSTQLTGALDIDNTIDLDTATANPVDITSSIQTASTVLHVYCSGADISAQQYLLALDYHDDGQANADFLVCRDHVSADTKFSISEEGNTAIAGTIDVDGSCNLGDTTAGSDVAIGNSTGNITCLGDNVDFTLTDATDDVFQLVKAGGSALFDIDLGTNDLITLSDGTVAVKINAATQVVKLANVTDTTNARTITSADYGKTIFYTYAGAVTVTLPAAGEPAGSWFRCCNANSDTTAPTYATPVADNLITFNNATADSVTYGTGHRIGSSVMFISNGSFWMAFNESANNTMTITDGA